MREILFRGKRTDNGEWVEGDLFRVFDDGFFITDGKCHSERIDPETVGQYTGLTDKNGKKVFEHDIVEMYYADGICEVGPIVWSADRLRYVFASPDGSAYGIEGAVMIEVIGNIHDQDLGDFDGKDTKTDSI